MGQHIGAHFSSLTWMAKYIFEYLYSIYVLNLKLNVIHGDLHLNNITTFIKKPYIDSKTYQPIFPNPCEIFNLRDTQYIFPTYGRMSGIIDFSRSIIGPESLLKDDKNTQSVIMDDQKRKISDLYKRELPDFYNTYSNELHIAIANNFSAVFKTFTAIDAYKLTNGFLYLLDSIKDKYTIAPEIPAFITRINRLAFNYVTIGMLKVIKTCGIPEEWPLYDIITSNFGDYIVEKFTPPENGISLVDYYSSENEMKYNTREYNRFPTNVKLDYVTKHKLKEHYQDIAAYKQYKKEKRDVKELQEVNDIQQAEIDDIADRRGIPKDIPNTPVIHEPSYVKSEGRDYSSSAFYSI